MISEQRRQEVLSVMKEILASEIHLVMLNGKLEEDIPPEKFDRFEKMWEHIKAAAVIATKIMDEYREGVVEDDQ